VDGYEEAEGTSSKGEIGCMRSSSFAENEGEEWAEKQADGGDCERKAEECDRRASEIEEVAHAECIVRWVLRKE